LRGDGEESGGKLHSEPNRFPLIYAFLASCAQLTFPAIARIRPDKTAKKKFKCKSNAASDLFPLPLFGLLPVYSRFASDLFVSACGGLAAMTNSKVSRRSLQPVMQDARPIVQPSEDRHKLREKFLAIRRPHIKSILIIHHITVCRFACYRLNISVRTRENYRFMAYYCRFCFFLL
jgi:hypothetical protein